MVNNKNNNNINNNNNSSNSLVFGRRQQLVTGTDYLRVQVNSLASFNTT